MDVTTEAAENLDWAIRALLDARDVSGDDPVLAAGSQQRTLAEARTSFEALPKPSQKAVLAASYRDSGLTTEGALERALTKFYTRVEKACAPGIAPGASQEALTDCADHLPGDLAMPFWARFVEPPRSLAPALAEVGTCPTTRVAGAIADGDLTLANRLARNPFCEPQVPASVVAGCEAWAATAIGGRLDSDTYVQALRGACSAETVDDLREAFAAQQERDAMAACAREVDDAITSGDVDWAYHRVWDVGRGRCSEATRSLASKTRAEAARQASCASDIAALERGDAPNWSDLGSRLEACGGKELRERGMALVPGVQARLRAEAPCKLAAGLSASRLPLQVGDADACVAWTQAQVEAGEAAKVFGAFELAYYIDSTTHRRVAVVLLGMLGPVAASDHRQRDQQLRALDLTLEGAPFARAAVRELLGQRHVEYLPPAETASLTTWPADPRGTAGRVVYTWDSDCVTVPRQRAVYHAPWIEYKSEPVYVDFVLSTRYTTTQHYGWTEWVDDGEDLSCVYSNLVIDAPYDWPDTRIAGTLSTSPVLVFDAQWPTVRADWIRRAVERARAHVAKAQTAAQRLDAAAELLVYVPGDVAAREVLLKELPLAPNETYPL